jgi:RHS repeat-associated protein
VKTRHDYLPFGEEILGTLQVSTGRNGVTGYGLFDGVRQQFTQKERDIETGLDYFGARYYNTILGRFSSSDNFLNDAHVSVPQSWNLYSYVHNNPLKYIDPTGEEVDGTALSLEQRKELIDDWKKKTGYKDITFVERNGRFILVINSEAGHEGGSETAREELRAAQESTSIFDLVSVDGTERTASVRFSQTGFPKAYDRTRGGLVFDVEIDFGDFSELRGYKDAVEANSIGLAVLHEIEHNLHGITTDYARPGPGDVEQRYINPIRKELGLPERQFYAPNHFSRGEIYDFLYYKTRDQTRQIVYWSKSQVEKRRTP